MHIVVVVIVGYGVYLSHTKVFNHVECDMTYSWRTFLPLAMPHQTDKRTPYQLFQFFDHRDPRHRETLRTKSFLSGRDGCLSRNTTAAVLYIPGHGGSYQQSRSLGAHGIQLTEADDRRRRLYAQQALFNGEWTGDASSRSLQEFVYEVYAVDFQEEGTGLHGLFIAEQSDFVADSIRHLSLHSCQYTSIVVVAHSLGGYAGRLAWVQHPDIRPFVQAMVTLGTPHAYPVLALDPSLYEIRKQLFRQKDKDDNDMVVVSISGGLRDEMIPPESCSIGSKANSLSLLAPLIMEAGHVESTEAPALGMDHRAVVWCRNLLDKVRALLFVLTKAGREGVGPAEKLTRLTKELGIDNDYDYNEVVKDLHKTLYVSTGSFSN